MSSDSYQWQSSASMKPYSGRESGIQRNKRQAAEIAAVRRKIEAGKENSVHIPEALRMRRAAATQLERARYM